MITALPPLVVELGVLVFGFLGNDVFALWFPKLQIFADAVDDDSALLALEDVAGEPGADELVAEVAKVK